MSCLGGLVAPLALSNDTFGITPIAHLLEAFIQHIKRLMVSVSFYSGRRGFPSKQTVGHKVSMLDEVTLVRFLELRVLDNPVDWYVF